MLYVLKLIDVNEAIREIVNRITEESKNQPLSLLQPYHICALFIVGNQNDTVHQEETR